jgi:hypothetical protein
MLGTPVLALSCANAEGDAKTKNRAPKRGKTLRISHLLNEEGKPPLKAAAMKF